MESARNFVSKPRIKLWLTIALMLILGVAGSIGQEMAPWEWVQHLVRDLAIALFVAALLAATVDQFFKTEFARDVFYAAFSYVLPDELKQEINRIINYRFLCKKHDMIIKLHPLDDQFVRLEFRLERTLYNISKNPEQISNSIATDEWGYSERSEIKECTMQFNGKKYESTTPRTDLGPEAIGIKTETISIKQDEKVTLISVACETKPKNSEFLISFVFPTVNPAVDVHLPTGFNHTFGFGVPNVDVIKSGIFERYELNGTQFPGQFYEVAMAAEGRPISIVRNCRRPRPVALINARPDKRLPVTAARPLGDRSWASINHRSPGRRGRTGTACASGARAAAAGN
jgi:hypothetical protein